MYPLENGSCINDYMIFLHVNQYISCGIPKFHTHVDLRKGKQYRNIYWLHTDQKNTRRWMTRERRGANYSGARQATM